ncbi:hypothetical protein C3941_02100 [Kaistia algarum]|nr:hypothetical protein C3941_02100 [Kaistia algarum]
MLWDYRPPRSLRSRVSRRPQVYIDTTYERATDDFFERVTLPALRTSKYLIVLVTPDSADRGPGQQDWIRREIEEFVAGPNPANIAIVRARGRDADPLPGRLSQSHPNVEVIDLRGIGPFAFLNPYRASRLANETVKLVAPLLGFGPEDMPALRREEERRQQVRLGATAGIGAAVTTAVAVLSIAAFSSRNHAVDALTRSMFASERVIQAVAGSMANGETRDQLLTSSCDLLDSLAPESGRDPASGPLATCAAERAAYRDNLKEHDEADKLVDSARLKIEQRFVEGGDADDGLALVDIARVALFRTIARPEQSRINAEIVAFVDNAKRVLDRIPEEVSPGRVAAEALQVAAVRLGDAGSFESAALAAGNSAAMWAAIATLDDSAELVLEHATAEGLSVLFLTKLERREQAGTARERGEALISHLSRDPSAAEKLKDRIEAVRQLLEQTAGEGSRS